MTSSASSIADDVLIKEVLDGNYEAFTQLIQKYKDLMYDLAHRTLRNAQEAEDVVQDAFIEIYKHLKDFNHRSRFSTWIYAILMNRIRNRIRRHKIIKWSSLDRTQETSEGSMPIEVAENRISMDAETGQRLELEAVKKEVKNLPLHFQTIFVMHYFEGMPLGEISEKLDRPLGTVKVYLHRAREILYKRLMPRRFYWQMNPAVEPELVAV